MPFIGINATWVIVAYDTNTKSLAVRGHGEVLNSCWLCLEQRVGFNSTRQGTVFFSLVPQIRIVSFVLRSSVLPQRLIQLRKRPRRLVLLPTTSRSRLRPLAPSQSAPLLCLQLSLSLPPMIWLVWLMALAWSTTLLFHSTSNHIISPWLFHSQLR